MNDYDFESSEFGFLDILTILSFVMGVQNVELNKQQIDMLMREMTEKQDHELEVIIKQNEEILKILNKKEYHMTDIKWLIDEQVCAANNGADVDATASAIINICAIAETETILAYQYAQRALNTIYAKDEKRAKIFYNMLNTIIADEGNHDASFKKAAAILSGYKAAKPKEYDEAIKE